ncbi:hypothetical protein GWK17_17720 [Bacillus selenatarsenatis]|uniref:Uncharacterized protein n=1 Tax=Mesobacillus selenatarsenatis TaxID=388741 RepID=A0A846TDX7_9BACI|nr:hypothetical protein [Mesobacillus selenatarsenatis]
MYWERLGTTECSMLQYQEFALQVQNGKSRSLALPESVRESQNGKSRSSALPEKRPGIQKR